jgi:hypothetical protein
MIEDRGFSYVTDVGYGILDLCAAANIPISYSKCERVADDCRQVTYLMLQQNILLLFKRHVVNITSLSAW